MLGLNPAGRDRRVEDEAVRLVSQLDMAVDEGLVSRSRLALFWTPGGYQVQCGAEEGWQKAAAPSVWPR